MAARVYHGVCLSGEQLESLAALGVTEDEIVDSSCESGISSNCGISLSELLSLYEFYDPTKGIYTEWGNIDVPWSLDDPWNSAKYTDEYSYRDGDRVIVIKNDGRLVVLYECTEDLPPPAGRFNESKWNEICRISVNDVGSVLPRIESLELEYEYWDSENTPYPTNSIVLKNSPCGDDTCVYLSLSETSSTPPSSAWSKLYCVENGRPNLCEESGKCRGKVVYLSSGFKDQICAPVESTTGQRSDA